MSQSECQLIGELSPIPHATLSRLIAYLLFSLRWPPLLVVKSMIIKTTTEMSLLPDITHVCRYLWHLWFICTVYKFTYLLNYLLIQLSPHLNALLDSHAKAITLPFTCCFLTTWTLVTEITVITKKWNQMVREECQVDDWVLVTYTRQCAACVLWHSCRQQRSMRGCWS